mmetsp:Transcript_18071/g.27329  ORF Transcript_18071/g.27329 Transcript_18071/m.27329 type:complete len:756 (+) Transcript_18071:26-2293(+)
MMDEAEPKTVDRNPFSNLILNGDGLDDECNDMQPLRKKKPKKISQRRRRRSSARFLHLTNNVEDSDDDEEDTPESEHLGELYKRAIRMNAENRINAGNSWNLRLIENMDKLIEEPSAHCEEKAENGHQAVNFTKASCTLDASVKIYSYRVDDVHLTSYKVLANLNRNDAVATKKSNKDDNGTMNNETGQHQGNAGMENGSKDCSKNVETLETNVANININRLDSAYDIDPLFHKMSKTFDEGGARGLLLVNLCVGGSGCNIVFDSTEDDSEGLDQKLPSEEGMIDISVLTSKLESTLGDILLENLELVPQMRTLRQEYATLEQEGFVEREEIRSRRYASSQEEEREAEISIHQEALERSMVSNARKSSVSRTTNTGLSQEQEDEQEYAADDYGGDDDDYAFTDFINNNSNEERFSSISFEAEPFSDNLFQSGGTAGTMAALNALCSTNDFSQNDYQFFSQETMERLDKNNHWAGSAHWKKTAQFQRKTNLKSKTGSKAGSSEKKKKKEKQCFVDLDSAMADMEELLKPANKTKRNPNPLQISKASKAKYTKESNLLPLDAGFGVKEFSKLFLRPSLAGSQGTGTNTKTVGFHTQITTNHDDESFGGDEDGFGFELADNHEEDDFIVEKLEGVRKVKKDHVGYATVAKKVDVKRLKKDLWSELETNFSIVQNDNFEDDAIVDDVIADDAIVDDHADVKERECKVLSFNETVNQMETNQSQSDVTVPFYFICLLHLANEKGLRLESEGLQDFNIIHN